MFLWERTCVVEAMQEALRRMAKRLDNAVHSEGILRSDLEVRCLDGCLTLFEPANAAPQAFSSCTDLVTFLSGSCGTDPKANVGEELLHCLRSETLSILFFRFVWPLRGQSSQRIWQTAQELAPSASLALLEQVASFAGHPTHPMWKTRTPLSFAELCAYAPEFGARIPVRVMAARASFMTFFPSLHEWKALWQREFPLALELMTGAVRPELQEQYAPVFVHPANVDNLRNRFAAAFDAHDLILVDKASYCTTPTLSLRTLIVTESYHAKLPVPVQATSWPRYVSPVEVQESAILSDYFGQMDLPCDLVLLQERFGCHANFGERFSYEDCRYCSMILRAWPMPLVQTGFKLVPLAVLFAQLDAEGPTLWQEFWSVHGLTSSNILGWFAAYASKVVAVQVGFFIRYGFTIEAHQQNTLLEFASDGFLARVFYREIGGGIEIDAERLAAFPALNFDSKLYPRQDILLTASHCIAMLRHTMLDSHLLPLSKLAASVFDIARGQFLTIVGRSIRETVAHVEQAPNDTWSEERFMDYGLSLQHALLEEPACVAKALLRMRLAGSKDYLFRESPNPLFGAAQ